MLPLSTYESAEPPSPSNTRAYHVEKRVEQRHSARLLTRKKSHSSKWAILGLLLWKLSSKLKPLQWQQPPVNPYSECLDSWCMNFMTLTLKPAQLTNLLPSSDPQTSPNYSFALLNWNSRKANLLNFRGELVSLMHVSGFPLACLLTYKAHLAKCATTSSCTCVCLAWDKRCWLGSNQTKGKGLRFC